MKIFINNNYLIHFSIISLHNVLEIVQCCYKLLSLYLKSTQGVFILDYKKTASFSVV